MTDRLPKCDKCGWHYWLTDEGRVVCRSDPHPDRASTQHYCDERRASRNEGECPQEENDE